MLKNLNNIVGFFKAYTRYDLRREIVAWFKLFTFYLPVILPLMFATAAIFIYFKPLPTSETHLATGQIGTLSNQMGNSFVGYFKRHGLELHEVNTTGLHAGLNQLDDHASEVNASFVTSGTATHEDYPNLVSLGSVDIAPLWLFYRGKSVETDDPFEYFRDKRINIGAEGTVTNKLFSRLMDLNNPGTGQRDNFLVLPHAEATQRLRNGQIEAVFIVDGYNSEIVQSLLQDPEINLMSFPLADAYTRKLPFLQKVTLPKASVDINHVRPASNVALLASSINLLVENELHPTVQWALLLAMQDYNLKSEHFFTEAGKLPAYKDKSFPLSFIANDFYTHGTPGLFNYLPLKIAALIQNVWLILLAVFLVVLPLLKKLSSSRSSMSQVFLWKGFWELRYLEDQLSEASDPEGLAYVLQKLQKLDTKVSESWVESQHMRHYYNLKRCIKDCEARLLKMQA